MDVRDARIGAATVREWSRTLPRGGSILELGSGHGVPLSQVLIDDTWGLMFLLPADVQKMVIRKVARALNRDGTFLFTSPEQADTWSDALTGCSSISLGSPAYQQILRAEGLTLIGKSSDEGGNHYYLAAKGPARDRRAETRDKDVE